ncbi:MAG: AAA-like domain-containing protein [Acidobacteria bacterium]|nr:AAA-like domain-containing protein [Acidobacteriota bacterium]
MNSDRWKQINELYYAALERSTQERELFLNDKCLGDDTLRMEVSSLLASNDEAGDFMNASAIEVAARTISAESDQPQIGERLGHYKIISPLGAGGMGEIYLAEDTRLNRKVAVKLLPRQFTRDADRVRRFKQEARAASSLNHPHIVTIFEIGEDRGWHYIVTEFIDGQTLRQRLTSGTIKIAEMIESIIQVAGALCAAHEAGIIHRDIKPENLMVRRDGYVKVLDFGIAKLTEQFGVDRPTRTDSFASSPEAVKTDPGHVMGTAHYISPDQLLGLELDGRSDVFSLGVVLYELITGRVPFDGSTPSAVIASILNEEPMPLARFSRTVPGELDRIVEKALRKDREERYQVIKDFALDLKNLRLEMEMEAKLKRASVAFPPAESKAASSAGMPTNVMPTESASHDREVIAKLEPIGGAVPLDSRFYIERPTDREFHEAIARQDSLVLVKGARQVGKTSLLARGLQRARENGAKVVLTDFQSLSADFLTSPEKLILTLAETLADQLGLEMYPSEMWNSFLSPGINFERFLRREVLGKIETQLVWGLDEVDRLFSCDFGSDIFGLFRSWHNKRALDPEGPWRRLTMIIGYATEAHLFITDLNQSPFNVGTRLALEDFDMMQVGELNHRYGSPLRDRAEIARYFRLLSGHPYLVRRGLHELVARNWTLPELEAHADQDEGPFGDHLRRMLVSLTQDPALCEVVQNVLQGRPSANTDSFYRLRSAGLMAGDSVRDLRPRCQLYATYLEKHLL